MKKASLIAVLLSLLIIVSGAFALDLPEIQAAGILYFGTASEYRPFVFRDDYDLTGFDIELVQEIGKRIGVSVNVIDMAFDGLIDSVDVGQVDLIGGAFSVTAARTLEVDFSDPYYENNALIVASSKANLPDSLEIANMTGMKFGVQRGTSFDQWLKTNLAGQGIIDLRSIYTFSDADAAMKALAAGTVDLVMLDQVVYEKSYASGGQYKVVNPEPSTETYAFAAAKGSPLLIAAVNDALASIKADGTLDQLTEKYFVGNFEDEAELTIARPAQEEIIQPAVAAPIPTATPIPPIKQPVDCKNVMVFMSDVSMPDGTKVNPGEKFTKTWQIYNNGSCTWYPGYQVVFISGDYMDGESAVVPVETIPGRTVDVSIELTAPSEPGMYCGYFQLRSPEGVLFGPTMTAKYIVTTDHVTAPAVGADPVITTWQANRYKGGKKFCPTVSWNVRNCVSVDIYVNHKLALRTPYCSGSEQFCPPGKGTFDYGIVGYGANKNTSFVFQYTNTGKNDNN